MSRNLALALGALVVVLAAGAGAFFLAGALAKRHPPEPRPAAAEPATAEVEKAAAELRSRNAELEKRVGELEKRLAALETGPKLPEALNEPAARERLADLLRRGDQGRGDGGRRRGNFNEMVRGTYDRLLRDAQAKTGLNEEKWKELAPVFNKHYEPVEKALAENGVLQLFEAGKVNALVAPGLPATLAALQKAMPEEAWKAFDAWRHEADNVLGGLYNPRAEFFLAGDEYKKATVAAAFDRRWNMIKRSLPDLNQALAAEGDKAKAVEDVLRKHVEKFNEAFPGQAWVNVMDEANREKVKKLADATGEEIKKLVGEEGFKKFDDWKRLPGNMAGTLFGEMPGGGRFELPAGGPQAPGGGFRGFRRMPGGEQPAPAPAPLPRPDQEVF